MSSKNAKSLRPPYSIAGRLNALFILSAFLILLGSYFYLYTALSGNISRHGERYLEDEMAVLQEMLGDPAFTPELVGKVYLKRSAMQTHKHYVRILSMDGETLFESPEMGLRLPPGAFPPPAGQGTSFPSREIWEGPEGGAFFLRSAWAGGETADTEPRVIQTALDVTHVSHILHEHFIRLTLSLTVAVLLSAGAGLLLTHRGLQPLRRITLAARRISATNLKERVFSPDWPREIADLAISFDRMLDRLQDAFDRLSRCTADLAHELRTPLNNLMGEAEVSLGRERTPEFYQQVIESSLEEYGRLAKLIDRIMFLAHADCNDIELHPAEMEAGEETVKICELFFTLADEKGITLACTGQAPLTADPGLCQRALSNLIANAINYTPPGGRVDIHAEQADQGTIIRISDTGLGIPSDQLPRVFDRFFRTPEARSTYPAGSGLGLALVKSIMDLHHGTISLESRPGEGTTATLVFPHKTSRQS